MKRGRTKNIAAGGNLVTQSKYTRERRKTNNVATKDQKDAIEETTTRKVVLKNENKDNDHEIEDDSMDVDLTNDLTDEIMLHIFSCLDKRALMKASQVCKRWNSIVKDKTLWRVISLAPITFELTDKGFLTLAKARLFFTEKLHICNSRVTFDMLSSMTTHCQHLKTLLFGRSCSFDVEISDGKEISFPNGIKTLDMRLATGNFDVLTQVKSNLDSIINVGVGPQSFEKLNLFEFVMKLPNLCFVDFTNSLRVCDLVIHQISRHCPNLQSLCLIGCTNVLGESFQDLVANCKNLKTMLLRYLRINDGVLSRNFWKDSILTEIDISACPRITYRGLYSFLQQLKHVEYLNMSYCGDGIAVNDTVLYEMAHARNLSKLRMLDIRWSFNISASALRALLLQCSNLSYLGVYQSFKVTATHMADFLITLPHIKTFEFGSSEAQYINSSPLLQQLTASTKIIRELSLINFASNNPEQDMLILEEFFRKALTLRRFNFCDCALSLVEMGRVALRYVEEEAKQLGVSRPSVKITTKWECALPPPVNTIDRVILQ